MNRAQLSQGPERGAYSYGRGQLARLIIGSFRFSQGRPELQVQILSHLVVQHGPRIRRELLPEATDRASRTLLRVAMNHRLHGPVAETTARDLIATQVATLDELLAAPAPPPCEPLNLAVGMAEADLDYLGRPQGRPRAGMIDAGRSSWIDPWTGLLAYHAVLRRSAGLAEFDAMFGTISQAMREAPGIPAIVRDAVTQHFLHHPEDRESNLDLDELLYKSS